MELRERRQETLKEKWRAHNQNRDFTPKDGQLDSMAMGLFGVMLTSLFIESIFWLVPRVFPEAKLIVSLIVTLIFIETLLNWHRSYFDVANWVTKETKEKYFPGEHETPQGWRNCIKCQVRLLTFCHRIRYTIHSVPITSLVILIISNIKPK